MLRNARPVSTSQVSGKRLRLACRLANGRSAPVASARQDLHGKIVTLACATY
jgi:hypothetical protein